MVRTRFNPLLINPHGPSPPWKTKSGKYTPSGYNAVWHSNVVSSPPSWNPLLLQDSSTYRMGVNKPSMKSVSFGSKKRSSKSKKPSKALRKVAKKYGVKVTSKRGKKRVYKTERVLKKQVKSAMRRSARKKHKTVKRKLNKRSNKKRYRVVKRKVKARGYLTELRSKVAHKRVMRDLRKYRGSKLKNDFGRLFF